MSLKVTLQINQSQSNYSRFCFSCWMVENVILVKKKAGLLSSSTHTNYWDKLPQRSGDGVFCYGTSSVLINPLTEHGHASKYSVSLGRRASWGSPADSTLKYPAASGILAYKRTPTVTMATAQNGSCFSSTNHVWRDLQRWATWDPKRVHLVEHKLAVKIRPRIFTLFG